MTRSFGVSNPGLLSPLLAWLRWRRAELLLAGTARGSILDVGAGTWPAFLDRLDFVERVALDRRAPDERWPAGISRSAVDLTTSHPWPFAHHSFDAVTFLAVLEHLPYEHAVASLREALRVLRPSGKLVATVPSRQGEALLHLLARCGLSSREHLEEHQGAHTRASLEALVAEAGFPPAGIATGRFEWGLNLWVSWQLRA